MNANRVIANNFLTFQYGNEFNANMGRSSATIRGSDTLNQVRETARMDPEPYTYELTSGFISDLGGTPDMFNNPDNPFHTPPIAQSSGGTYNTPDNVGTAVLAGSTGGWGISDLKNLADPFYVIKANIYVILAVILIGFGIWALIGDRATEVIIKTTKAVA